MSKDEQAKFRDFERQGESPLQAALDAAARDVIYDAVMRQGVNIIGLGTVANLADVQLDVEQPTERQPIMIDISGILASDTRSVSIPMPDGKRLTMRVVEDAKVVLMEGSSLMGHCTGCGHCTLVIHPHCPGCGNPIKR